MPSPNEIAGTGENERQEGLIERSDAIILGLSKDKAQETIGKRISEGERYWNKELGLDKVREKNFKRWNNKNFEVSNQSDLYDYQADYRDNRIFLSVETLASNMVSRIPVPDVMEAQDTDASRELASNFGKILYRKADSMGLKGQFQMMARHLLMGYRLGVMKIYQDFNAGILKKDGEYTGDVCVKTIRPHNIVLDAYADDPFNVPLIAENVFKSVEEMGSLFPDKKDELILSVKAKEGESHVGMSSRIGYYETYFTYFDDDYKREGVGWTYNDLLLDFGPNPYYNYNPGANESNFLPQPSKPYVLFNFLREGKYAIDDTSLTEQAASQQDILERRGRQIVDNADQANAARVFNTMMIKASDAQKYTGDPNDNILVKGDVRMAFARVPAPSLPRYVLEDKYDARREVDNIFGTHAPLRGEGSESPTLGQEVMSQRSDLGRTASLTEAIEKGATRVYELMAQVMKVFAVEEQVVRYVGSDTGRTTFIKFMNDKIEDGVEIIVRPGSMAPDDKMSDRNEAVELAKAGGRIDPLTFAEKWHIDKPAEFAKRLFMFLFMPDQYAQEILHMGESGGDAEAMANLQKMMQGEGVPAKKDASKEYVAYMAQFLQSPAFKELDPEVQGLIIAHARGTAQASRGGLKEKSKRKKNVIRTVMDNVRDRLLFTK